MPQPLRSVLAVLAGFLAIMILVLSLTLCCVKLLHLQSGHPTPLYLTLNVLYSLAAAMFGGYVAGRLGRRSPVGHGVALAVVMLGFSLFQLLHPAPGQTMAYLIFLSIAPPLAAVAGAKVAARTSTPD